MTSIMLLRAEQKHNDDAPIAFFAASNVNQYQLNSSSPVVTLEK